MANAAANMHERKPRRTGRRLRGFSKDQGGTSAVEFAILAMPFLLVIFSIIEMSLAFFAERVLQDGLMEAKRQVRLGKVRDEAGFRAAMCQAGGVRILLDCGGIRVSIREVPNGGPPPGPPRDADGNIDLGRLAFAPGQRETTNIVRAYYKWPRFLPVGMTAGGAYVSTSPDTLLEAAGVFQIEP